MAELTDRERLKTLVPPNGLDAGKFQELCGKAAVEALRPGEILFEAGELDRKTLYLLSGDVELISKKDGTQIVRGGSELARQPLASQQPRVVTARARTNVTFTKFDNDLLDVLVTWQQVSGIEVREIPTKEEGKQEPCEDWMTCILQSKVFLQIPPANIQRMFMLLKEIHFKAGDTVMKQGEEGDCYYIVNSGRCVVTRSSSTGQQVKLTELVNGDAFGEEAVLSDAKRSATVTMLTDGTLMRLSKGDFHQLLKAPLQKEVDFKQAKRMVMEGATLLDVRTESEHKGKCIRGSLNVPMYLLRMKARSLDRAKKYVVYCDTGRRSSAAVYLLNERGFDARVLKGGLNAMQTEKNS